MLALDRYSFRTYTLALALSMLGGCQIATKPPTEVYRTVSVQVPVSCVPKTLAAPPDAGFVTQAQLLAIPNGPSRYVAMAEDWMNRVARMNDTESVIAACQKVAPAP